MRTHLINDLTKSIKKFIKANVMVPQNFRKLLCWIGFHNYRLIKRQYTFVDVGSIPGSNRRAKTEIHICKYCRHQKIIVDPYNTIL